MTMAWSNGMTTLCLILLINASLIYIIAVLRYIIFPRSPVQFGTRIRSFVENELIEPDGGHAAAVVPIQQIGLNGGISRPIQLQIKPMEHWSLEVRWMRVGMSAQISIFLMFLIAMCLDTWSIASIADPSSNTTIQYGVVGVRSSSDLSQSTLSSSYSPNEDDSQPSGTLKAAGGLTLAFGLIGLITMLILTIKSIASTVWRTKFGWDQWQHRLGILQLITSGFLLFVWLTGGHLNLIQLYDSSTITLGVSWFLTFASFIVTLFLSRYYRNAIEYRSNGEPMKEGVDSSEFSSPSLHPSDAPPPYNEVEPPPYEVPEEGSPHSSSPASSASSSPQRNQDRLELCHVRHNSASVPTEEDEFDSHLSGLM